MKFDTSNLMLAIVVVSLILNFICMKLLLLIIKRMDSKDFSKLNPGSTKKSTLTYIFIAMTVYSVSLTLAVFFPLSYNPILALSGIVFFSVDLLIMKLNNKKLYSFFWVFASVFLIAILLWSLFSLGKINAEFVTICLTTFILFIRLPYWISFWYVMKRNQMQ
jgi:hypothetical protein